MPIADMRVNVIRDFRLVKAPKAGNWVHHDQLDLFLKKTTEFLAE